MAYLSECTGQNIKSKMKIALTVITCKVFGWNVPEAKILSVDRICIRSMSRAEKEATNNGKGMGGFKLANYSS